MLVGIILFFMSLYDKMKYKIPLHKGLMRSLRLFLKGLYVIGLYIHQIFYYWLILEI